MLCLRVWSKLHNHRQQGTNIASAAARIPPPTAPQSSWHRQLQPQAVALRQLCMTLGHQSLLTPSTQTALVRWPHTVHLPSCAPSTTPWLANVVRMLTCTPSLCRSLLAHTLYHHQSALLCTTTVTSSFMETATSHRRMAAGRSFTHSPRYRQSAPTAARGRRCSSELTNVLENAFMVVQQDQLVSGVDWCDATNQIVTCSHDRNSFV